MSDHTPLDCLKCPSLCCKTAGYVEVSREDIRRLAKALGLTARQFEERHIVEVTRKRRKLIKAGYETCQFLADDTVFEAARFFQMPIATLREMEKKEGADG